MSFPTNPESNCGKVRCSSDSLLLKSLSGFPSPVMTRLLQMPYRCLTSDGKYSEFRNIVGSVGTAFVSEDKGGCIGTGHRLWLCFALSVMSHFWSCVILPGRTLIDKYKSGSWRRDGDGWSESMPKLEKELVATVTVHHSSYPADWIHKLCFMWLCLAWASLATLTMGRRVGHQTENSPTNTTAHTHTLDKNGSLYDPAGTESWNMQKDRKQIY